MLLLALPRLWLIAAAALAAAVWSACNGSRRPGQQVRQLRRCRAFHYAMPCCCHELLGREELARPKLESRKCRGVACVCLGSNQHISNVDLIQQQLVACTAYRR
jgi:hypothetical protein